MPEPKDQNDQAEDLDLTDGEAKQLIADADEDSSEAGGKDDTPDPAADAESEKDWKAEADKWRQLSRKNEKSFKDIAARLKQYEDANKSESQRLQEDRDSYRARAEKAEAALLRREIAERLAPEHATAKQIAQVAKRMSGDDEDALEADASELFELIAPEPKTAPKTPTRPKERLKGGAEPDEEPEEVDPRKLAALVPRRR